MGALREPLHREAEPEVELRQLRLACSSGCSKYGKYSEQGGYITHTKSQRNLGDGCIKREEERNKTEPHAAPTHSAPTHAMVS